MEMMGNDDVGGLVGNQNGGSITSSYATGNPDGGEDDSDSVGGLVGNQNSGSIISSYATGESRWGGVAADYVGGLVGDSGKWWHASSPAMPQAIPMGGRA